MHLVDHELGHRSDQRHQDGVRRLLSELLDDGVDVLRRGRFPVQVGEAPIQPAERRPQLLRTR
ncbi:hypothetical protein DEJ12_14875 [Curtobacterium sp. MCLR17_059]|nr:hypothetical protein DEJ12_14875 [Curtobacterium sp. MCLR17_059]PZF51376.1 hypothetical protein DEJ10_09285 [Curtobacterium sp. MCLR17_057]